MKSSETRRGRWLSEIGIRIATVLLLVLMAWSYSAYKVRSSDFEVTDKPPARSGLRVFTDRATHCQYVSSENGGLTLRRDADGKPMCGPDT